MIGSRCAGACVRACNMRAIANSPPRICLAAVFCVGLVTEIKYGSTANDRSSKIDVRYRT